MSQRHYGITQTAQLLCAAATAWRLDVEVRIVSGNSWSVTQTGGHSYLVRYLDDDQRTPLEDSTDSAIEAPAVAPGLLPTPPTFRWSINDQQQVVDSAGSLAGLLLALRHLLDEQFRPGRAIVGLRAPDRL
jgi:hypothetical protein